MASMRRAQIWYIAIFSAVSFAALGGILYAYAGTVSKAPEHATILRTEQGFEPNHVRIKQGGSVTFLSDGKDFWPAANAHPFHDSYPAFDPKRPLGGDEEWTFVFDKAGVWDFHDHLFSQARGVVEVLGKDETEKTDCAEATGTLVATCWGQNLEMVLEREGLAAAFDAFVHMYRENPEFQQNCHDITHTLGRAAYRDFAEHDSTIGHDAARYCGFGFYHGFIEAMLARQGSGFFEDGRRYCELLAFSTEFSSKALARHARSSCYHGLGHAVFDSIESSAWGDDGAMMSSALRACERIVNQPGKRAWCASGVSNALAIAYSNKYYKLAFNPDDPFKICREQKEIYQPACFTEIGIYFINGLDKPIEYSLEVAESMPQGAVREHFILSVMDDEVRYQNKNTPIGTLRTLCLAYDETKLRRACLEGILLGLRDSGEPGSEHVAMLSFCDSLPSGEPANFCLHESITFMERTMDSAEAHATACQGNLERRTAICSNIDP